MDPQTLAQQIVPFLAPFLPYLLKMGEKAAEEAGEKLGETAWEQAKTLWAKLSGQDKVAKVAETVAAIPDNEALQAALRQEIAGALNKDANLAAEIARLWEAARAVGVTVTAAGDRSVAIGGGVSGSAIITGDRNKVERA